MSRRLLSPEQTAAIFKTPIRFGDLTKCPRLNLFITLTPGFNDLKVMPAPCQACCPAIRNLCYEPNLSTVVFQ